MLHARQGPPDRLGQHRDKEAFSHAANRLLNLAAHHTANRTAHRLTNLAATHAAHHAGKKPGQRETQEPLNRPAQDRENRLEKKHRGDEGGQER